MCEYVTASGNTLILYSACTGHYIVSCSYHSKRTPTTFFLFCPSSPLRYPPSKCSNYVAFFRFLCPLSVSKDMQRHISLSLHQERLKSSISCQKRQSVFKLIAPSDVVTLSYSVCICRNAASKCAKALSLSVCCSFVNDRS